MAKNNSAVGVELGDQFHEVRQTLLQAEYADRLSKPLQFWVLPSDRRLPLALLGRTVGDLLATPFEELSATPGIGQKKIRSMVNLLDRATKDEPPLVSFGGNESSAGVLEDEVLDSSTESVDANAASVKFDPTIVSEALWVEWRHRVRNSGIQDEKLGRMAPSLQRLPTVIWHTPLQHYLDHTVAEIRGLRTHGEKRVRCVLEVFHSVYHRLDQATSGADLSHLLTPSWVKSLEAWGAEQLANDGIFDDEQVMHGFVAPLISMIEVDCGPTVLRLVKQRLGIEGPAMSVREQARSLGVTRARVYQLLDDCAKVMNVRWPLGRRHLDRLAQDFSRSEVDHHPLRLFFGLRELCFPDKQTDEMFKGRFFASNRGTDVGQPPTESQPTLSSSTSSGGVDEIGLNPNHPGASMVQRSDETEGPSISYTRR